MRDQHLTSEEVLAVLLGEEDASTRSHWEACSLCKSELASWKQLQGEARHWKPHFLRRRLVLLRALVRARPAYLWRWALPLATAAGVLAMALWNGGGSGPAPDVDAVLEEVELTLASDPLAALADAQVVTVVVPEVSSGERSQV
ncbi:MAG: hypothetical protein NZ869_03530 [Thermoanaerobaculum sp.]|nr:hypothetical protein [Thermoanaerobaculum sp.]MDW7968297.1 hypothetical protein [Thermoanaerobaculum sp.]